VKYYLRYLRIVSFFAGVVLQVVVVDIILRQIGLRRLARKTMRKRYTRFAVRFRSLAIRMGGVMIKVGQFLSSRVDVLPEYIVNELSNLQDEVPAEPFQNIQTVIESEFHKPFDQIYQDFAQTPSAAASLGQVHMAVLFSGETVAVKVQRYNIQKIVDTDLSALRTVIGWLKHWKEISKRADVIALFKEFSLVLLDELDYLKEAENARKFAEMFKDDAGVRVPKVYAEFTTRCVLTLEDVRFIKITDYDQITNAGIDRKEVASRLLETYLRQIFIESFFHADPHPGNLFVEPPGEDHGWRLVFVDFGMVGRITPHVRNAMREMVIAVVSQDAERMVKSFVEIGAILPGADLKRLEEVMRILFQQFWGKTMDELRSMDHREMHRVAYQFRDVMYENPFQIPENLIYLGRCIAILSGMCTGLYPGFNLFQELLPFGEKLLAEETQNRGVQYWIEQAVDIGRKLIALPSRFDRLLSDLESGKIEVQTKPAKTQIQQNQQLISSIGTLTGGILTAAFVASGAYLLVHGYPQLGYGIWGIAVLGLGWMVFRKKP